MDIKSIDQKIAQYHAEGKKLFTSSSFQTHSLVLLHILSKIAPEVPVYFIQTGYHFPETVAFKDQVAEEFGLKVLEVKSEVPKFMQRDKNGRFYYTSDPDYCCYLNKTKPMESVLQSHDVWINGVRADQSAIRKAMKVEQAAPGGKMRFHPMLDWSNKMIFDYIKENNLPRHPLDEQGYMSIGCEPCTRKPDLNMSEREARWFGLNKTECGLHTDLVSKS